MTRSMEALCIRGGDRFARTETVAAEEVLCLYLNGNLVVRLLASPFQLEDLAVGFLLSEGLVSRPADIVSVKEGGASTTLFVEARTEAPDPVMLAGAARTSGCGGGITMGTGAGALAPVASDLRAGADEILSLAREFERSSVHFRRTGCVHACGLARQGRLVLLREDVGRHNALDKVLGAALGGSIDLESSIVLLSGRISSEMVTKAARTGVSLLVSRGAPTATAVEMARDLGVCVAGFVRGGRMNVYTHADRVT